MTTVNALAVVIITIGRESLLRAVRSVFQQQTCLPMQILIGVDCDRTGQIPHWQSILAEECPAHITLTWLDLGYSTSQRHGGIHASHYGGSLRSALTLLANAPIVTFLDDDDWFLPTHCPKMIAAFQQYPDIVWAHSLCYYADGDRNLPLCVDELESVGRDAGIYRDRFGGFVRPSGLTLDVRKTLPFIHTLAQAMTTSGDGEDRLLFAQLKAYCHVNLGEPTVCCALDPKDNAHASRMAFIESRIGKIAAIEKRQSSR